jgi:hypothetical protein
MKEKGHYYKKCKKGIKNYYDSHRDEIRNYQREYHRNYSRKHPLTEAQKEHRKNYYLIYRERQKAIDLRKSVSTNSEGYYIPKDLDIYKPGLVYVNELSLKQFLKHINLSNPLKFKEMELTLINNDPTLLLFRVLGGETKLVLYFDKRGRIKKIRCGYLKEYTWSDMVFEIIILHKYKEVYIYYHDYDREQHKLVFDIKKVKDINKFLQVELTELFNNKMICRGFDPTVIT